MASEEIKVIPHFFVGKNVLLTGGAGFIGKVMIEKLLRSCPGVGKIYLLVRPKKGMQYYDRLEKIISYPIFDKIKETQPGDIPNKLRVISGNMAHLGLGLSDEDRQTLIRDVNIIFHCAASVRFDDPLQDAIFTNTRGTRELCSLALEMNNLYVLVHVSTTYCNCDRRIVDEILYPPPADWRQMIEIAEKVDKHTLQILSTKVTDKHPNTYTFAKALSEHVINDMLQGKVPAVIFRPSIVVSAMAEPLPGWIDNFNGPVALTVATAKGILRTGIVGPDIIGDFMPVDICVKGIIGGAWYYGTSRDVSEVGVYNCSSYGHQPVTATQSIKMAEKILWEIPIYTVLWYPGGSITSSKLWYYINVMLLHLLPAIFVDLGLLLIGKKPILVGIQRKVYIATMALQHFLVNQWTFLNNKLIEKEATVVPDNCKEEFGFDRFSVDPDAYFRIAMMGGRKYLLKDLSDYDVARKRLYKMWLLDCFVKILFCVGIFWLLFFKLDILSLIWNGLVNYVKKRFRMHASDSVYCYLFENGNEML